MDKQTEGKMVDAIHGLFKDMTVLIVSHRLDTLMGLDRVLVFEDGRIVEDGPPRLLLGRNDSRFGRLYYGGE